MRGWQERLESYPAVRQSLQWVKGILAQEQSNYQPEVSSPEESSPKVEEIDEEEVIRDEEEDSESESDRRQPEEIAPLQNQTFEFQKQPKEEPPQFIFTDRSPFQADTQSFYSDVSGRKKLKARRRTQRNTFVSTSTVIFNFESPETSSSYPVPSKPHQDQGNEQRNQREGWIIIVLC